ncbi:hypothetical protein C5C13_06155 [Clavibacter michiganensis]|nr:hypothetical protein C5C13_06155 [Clavibacter michiganensis]
MFHVTPSRARASTAAGLLIVLALAGPGSAAASARVAPAEPSTASSTAAAVRVPAPTVTLDAIDFSDIAQIRLLVSADLSGLADTSELRYEYQLDGVGPWIAVTGGVSADVAPVAAPAPPGRHMIAVRVAGTVRGAAVVGSASAAVQARSVGLSLEYRPEAVVDGPSVTFRWDLREAFNGSLPEENTVSYQVGAGAPVDAGAVGSVTVTPGYGQVVGFDLTYGTVPDYWRYAHAEAATAPAPGAITLTRTPLPVVVGTVEVGSTLTARTCMWLPAPVDLGFQWFRDGVRIAGATASTYTVDGYDILHRITVAVRGSREGYVPVVRTSGPTKVVAPPVLVAGTPRITGNATVGRTLTAQSGIWKPASLTLQCKWKRDGVAIPGATARTYALTAADRGRIVTVTVYAIDPDFGFEARNATGVRVR